MNLLQRWRAKRLARALAEHPYWEARHLHEVPIESGGVRLHLEHLERVRSARLRRAFVGIDPTSSY